MKKIINLLLLCMLAFMLTGCDWLNPTEEVPPISIEIDGNEKVQIGKKVSLNAAVKPDNSMQDVIWSSSDDSIATVDELGIVTGKAVGQATITAKSKAREEIIETFVITVVADAASLITEIMVFGDNEVYAGGSINLSVSEGLLASDVIWNSSNNNILNVTQTGKVTGLNVGSAYITVIYKANQEIKCEFGITVLERTGVTQKINIIGQTEIYKNYYITLKVNPIPSTGSNLVNWESSNEKVATVDANGRVKGVGIGAATIKAVLKGNNTVYASIDVTVFENIDLSTITDVEERIQAIIENSSRSTFGVINLVKNIEGVLVKSSTGSGFVYKTIAILEDGNKVMDISSINDITKVECFGYYFITNKHVVEDADAIRIYNGIEEIPAQVIQYDDKVDVSVVYFEYENYIKPLELADVSNLKAGSFAVAIGSPSGFSYYNSATFGIISAPVRYISEDTDGDDTNDWDGKYIQHDAAINPGNSGGPLLNLNGQVIGINTLKLVATNIDNMGFSVPSDVILELIPLLEAGTKPQRAILGINVMNIAQSQGQTEYQVPDGIDYGMYVISVDDGGAGKKAGLQIDDIILSLDGIDLKETYLIRQELSKHILGSGDISYMEVYRNGGIIILEIIY